MEIFNFNSDKNIQLSDDINVYLGEITETGTITYSKEWVARENNNAAIFIENDNINFENVDILISDINYNTIIETKFIKLPKNEFVNIERLPINYISELSINIASLNGYSGELNIEVPEYNIRATVLVENAVEELDTLEECNSNNLQFDDLGQETDSYEILEQLLIIEESEEEKITKDKIEDKIKYITNTFIDALNVNINISDFQHEASNLEGNIIIEKINNRYSATISGIGFRNFKMLDNNDSSTFIFEEGAVKFLDKIKTRLKNMYSMSDLDLSQLKIIMILDKQDDDFSDEIVVISREDAIKLASNKGINIIKIENKDLELSFVDDSQRRIQIKANLSGTLGLRSFIEELVLELDSDIKVFEKNCKDKEVVCLTDLLM